MIRNINKMIAGHVNDNSVKYFFLILCFAAGIAAGALFVGALPSEKCEELMTAISGFAAWIDDGEIKPVSTFRLSMINNLRSVALLYVCGMSLYLSALAYIHMIAKGFVIGFTVGFMSLFFGGKGFLLAAVSVLPQSVLLVPALAIMSVLSINHAIARSKSPRHGIMRTDNRRRLLRYTCSTGWICCLIFLSALVDAFVIPVFVKTVSGLF
jgi:stage II sporulation protein M